MADGHSPDHVHCLECWSRRQMLPAEALARITMTEDWSPEDMAFEPRPMTQEQAVAAELMTAAIGRYWKAFGVDLTGARLNALLLVLRERAKATRANARILQARAGINARARQAFGRGDTDAMRAIEAEPTPDYPGKARDDAALGIGQPEVKQLQGVSG
jgi:hypothetical protein